MSAARDYPRIVVAPPGPKARAVVAKHDEYASTSLPKEYPLVIARGERAMVEDVDGNRYLDFMAGIAVTSTGYNHPAVVAAVREAAGQFLHICGADFYFEKFSLLCERLARLAPGSSKKRVFLCNSGAEAVEGAKKLARHSTGRPAFIAFTGSFHGRTYGAVSLTASKTVQRAGFGPFLPEVYHVAYPYPYRCDSDATRFSLDQIEDLFAKRLDPKSVAAIVVEPIQGEGGYLVPPDSFLPGLRALCDRHGILLIFDEVQCGIGRSGRMFASQHWGVSPDIMTLAKGLASGLPTGLVVARRTHMEKWQRGAHGNTFGGNPLCCAAALATLELVEREYAANAAAVGDYFIGRLRELQQRFPCIGDVRGKGLMIGMELVTDRTSRAPAKKLCEAVLTRAYHQGLLLLSCGASTVRFIPPLMINRGHVDEALSLLEPALREALAAV
jgi:4-aminobutyrate aminotransferase